MILNIFIYVLTKSLLIRVVVPDYYCECIPISQKLMIKNKAVHFVRVNDWDEYIEQLQL